MSDVERIWFWLEARGTAPVASVRDFVRRDRWARNADVFARNHLREGSGTFSFNPALRLRSDIGLMTLDYSIQYSEAA